MNMSSTAATIVHVVAGIIAAASYLLSPALPIASAGVFGVYELRQSQEIGDIAHTALRHFAVAFFITLGVILIMKLWGFCNG